MTDWYVEGPGHTTWGPYTYDDAEVIARAYAHEADGERSVGLFAHQTSVYSKIYDEELPPMPDTTDVSLPWANR
jgi:hypothetical protein